MRKLAADHKLMACLAAILIVTALLGMISYSVLSRVNRTFEVAVNSTARKLQLAGEINAAAGDMLAAQREILLDSRTSEANLKLFKERSAQVDRDGAELESLAIDRQETEMIGVVEISNLAYRKIIEDLERSYGISSTDMVKVKRAYKDIDFNAEELGMLESRYLDDALRATQTRLKYGRIALGICAGITLLVVLIALRTVRGIGLALRASVEQAHDSAAILNSIMNSMPCAVAIFDPKGGIRRFNQNFLGYSFEEVREMGILAAIMPESVEAVKETLTKTMETGSGATEAYIRASDGLIVPTFLSHCRFVYEGEPCILGVAIDISKQKMAEQYSRLQRVALEAASEAIVITDRTGDIQWANPAFTSLTGYGLEEVLGVNPRILKSGIMDIAFYQTLWTTITQGEKWSGELWNLTKDGNLYSEEMHIAPVRAMDGRISNFVAVKHDITERKQLEAQAERSKRGLESLNQELREANESILKLSQTDALTGLANRRTLDERMHHKMARAERLGTGFSVILGDLDHFKSINDEFGHLIGDQVLIAAGGVLAKQARAYDLPARFGGEEFIVILPENTLADAMSYAQRVRAAIGELTVPGMERRITMSLGISTWEHGDTLGELIGRADAALYQAKRRGRNRVVAQTSDQQKAPQSRVVQGDLREVPLM